MLGEVFKALPPGTKVFQGLDKQKALKNMRELLHAAKMPGAMQLRTHDLRRGHAQDLAKRGCNLRQLLEAAQWRSSAFTAYLDMDGVEDDAVAKSHTVGNSSTSEVQEGEACLDESSSSSSDSN